MLFRLSVGRIWLWIPSDLRAITSPHLRPENSGDGKGFRSPLSVKPAALPQDLVPPCAPRPCFLTTPSASCPDSECWPHARPEAVW